jgi:hypothetical protein
VIGTKLGDFNIRATIQFLLEILDIELVSGRESWIQLLDVKFLKIAHDWVDVDTEKASDGADD